jgi:hypothetical protein
MWCALQMTASLHSKLRHPEQYFKLHRRSTILPEDFRPKMVTCELTIPSDAVDESTAYAQAAMKQLDCVHKRRARAAGRSARTGGVANGAATRAASRSTSILERSRKRKAEETACTSAAVVAVAAAARESGGERGGANSGAAVAVVNPTESLCQGGWASFTVEGSRPASANTLGGAASHQPEGAVAWQEPLAGAGVALPTPDKPTRQDDSSDGIHDSGGGCSFQDLYPDAFGAQEATGSTHAAGHTHKVLSENIAGRAAQATASAAHFGSAPSATASCTPQEASSVAPASIAPGGKPPSSGLAGQGVACLPGWQGDFGAVGVAAGGVAEGCTRGRAIVVLDSNSEDDPFESLSGVHVMSLSLQGSAFYGCGRVFNFLAPAQEQLLCQHADPGHNGRQQLTGR